MSTFPDLPTHDELKEQYVIIGPVDHPKPWRTGRDVGRTLYNGRDELIGLLDERELADEVVRAVNALARVEQVLQGWEGIQKLTGKKSLVARGFAAEIRAALADG